MNDWLKVIIPVLLVAILGWVSTMEVKLSELKNDQKGGEKHVQRLNTNTNRIDKIETNVTEIKNKQFQSERYLQKIDDNENFIKDIHKDVNSLDKDVNTIKIKISNLKLIQDILNIKHPIEHTKP